MKHLLIVTDPGKSLDDECTLILAAGLARQGIVKFLGVVAALVPAAKRALLAKGTLKELGFADIPVGVGTDMRADNGDSAHEFCHVSYMASAGEVEPAAQLLEREFARAADKSITLLVIAGMTDVAEYLRGNEDVFKNKVEQVVIMGGVNQADDKVQLDAGGFMTPDSAANNAFDPAASNFVYRKVQEIGVPMTVLTREAAYAARVSRSIYKQMAATGHPVGMKVDESQNRMADDLWHLVNLPCGDPSRLGMPARFDRQWFCHTYCGGAGAERAANSSIWDLVQTANLYDPMTLLAAIPAFRDQFYSPHVVRVRAVDHLIIGLSKQVNGLKDRQALVDFLQRELVAALAQQTQPRVGD